MKFGQLIENQKISKKSKLSISLDQQSKVLHNLLSLYVKLKAIQIYKNQAADHLILLHVNTSEKTKKGLELVSLPHFCMIFEERYFSCCILLSLNFIVWLLSLREILDNMCVVIVF